MPERPTTRETEIVPGFTFGEFRDGLGYMSPGIDEYLPAARVIEHHYHTTLHIPSREDARAITNLVEATGTFLQDTVMVSALLIGEDLQGTPTEIIDQYDLRLSRRLRPHVRDVISEARLPADAHLGAHASLSGFLLLQASGAIERQMQAEGINPGETLHHTLRIDASLKEVCKAIADNEPYETNNPLLRRIVARLTEAYKLLDNREVSIDVVASLAPYMLLGSPKGELTSGDIEAATEQIVQEASEFGCEVNFSITDRNRAEIERGVRFRHNWLKENPDRIHDSMRRAFNLLMLNKMARHWINGIATGGLKLNSTLTLGNDRTVLRDHVVEELELMELEAVERHWVQVGPDTGTGPDRQSQGHKVESDDPEHLPPHIDIDRLNWLKHLRDTWRIPGARIVRRPLSHKERAVAADKGITPERAYRGYYVVLLPRELPSGEIVYDAVADSLVRGRHGVRAWKWQTGCKADGTILFRPWHVFSRNKAWAKFLGARRFYHTPTMRDRVQRYIESDIEPADPPEAVVQSFMAYLAIAHHVEDS